MVSHAFERIVLSETLRCEMFLLTFECINAEAVSP